MPLMTAAIPIPADHPVIWAGSALLVSVVDVVVDVVLTGAAVVVGAVLPPY